MSVLVTFNGSSYTVPTNNNVGWGTNLTSYLVAIAAGCLQKTGGSFTLSAETDFGGAFGLKSLYYKSRSSNIADAGIIRMANNSDAVAWRNFANTGNNLLTVDTLDQLTFNGSPVSTGGGTVLPGIVNTLAYYPTSTNTVDDLPAITASRALVSDSSGLPVASVTTTTELSYVNGVTSDIQTQINTKATDSLVVHLAGTETVTGTKTFSSPSGIISNTGATDLANRLTLTETDGQSFFIATNDAPTTGQVILSINRNPVDGVFSQTGQAAAFLQFDSANGAGSMRIRASSTNNTTPDVVAEFLRTGVAIRGTNTNNSAPSGFVGEYIESLVSIGSSINAGTSTQYKDITSISLTAGDWDVTGCPTVTINGSTITAWIGAVSVNSNNTTTDQTISLNQIYAVPPTSAYESHATIACYRLSLSATTTVYLKGAATYSAGTPKIYGFIRARRVR